MNILILNWRDIKNPKSGGAEIVTMMHAKEWIKKGHGVTWFTSRFKDAPRLELVEGVEIVRLGNHIMVHLLAPLYYLLNKKKFDFVIDEIHGVPFMTPLYVRKPLIAFIHEVAEEIWDYVYPFPVSKIGRIYEKIYLKLYKNIHFWTDAGSTVQDLLKHGVEKNKCIVIPCPFKGSIVRLPQEKKRPYNFVFISRLVKMKGAEDVLRAFSIINQFDNDTTLSIIGGGEAEYIKYLKSIAKNLGLQKKIQFLGRISDNEKYRILKHSFVLLHASIKEGWGLVVIEAASQSTPSVVYNVNGLRETVLHGKTGVIVKENNYVGLANGAIELLRDNKQYSKLQKECLRWAKKISGLQPMNKSLRLLETVKNRSNQIT